MNSAKSIHVEIDEVGSKTRKINIKDFDAFYNSHKATIDGMNMKTFNNRFILVDDLNNRYKLMRRKNRGFIITKINPDKLLTKYDVINKLAEFESMIKTEINKFSKEFNETKEPDLSKHTERFTI